MAKVGCLQEVSLCLQQENSENISKIFSNLTYELHSKQFKFLDLAELLNKGVCRCYAVEWCVPKVLRGDFVRLR